MAAPRKKNENGTADKDSSAQRRWWIDQGKARERKALPSNDKPTGGASFFQAGIGYDQDTARSRLTDLNLKLLAEGAPPENGWGYLQMTPDRFPTRTLEQIKRAVPLGPGVRALAVDSGVSLRVILTGNPQGERLLELRFGEQSSFDAWVSGEWVEEALFERLPEALRAAGAFVTQYLPGPDEPASR